MRFIKGLSIRAKLLAIAILPLFLVSVFATKTLYLYYTENTGLSKANDLRDVGLAGTQLVHELQKERGATAVFIGSEGKRFTTELARQRAVTDQAVKNYHAAIEIYNKIASEAKLIDLISRVDKKIDEISQLRRDVDGLNTSLGQALGWYTSKNADLLNIAALLSVEYNDSSLSRMASAYQYLLQSKERAGIERAVISGVFAADSASPEQRQKMISVGVEQSTFRDMFSKIALPDSIAVVNSLLKDPVVTEVERMRKVAWSKSDNFNVDAKYWFDQATKRINLLKQAEDSLAEELYVTSTKLMGEGYQAMLALSAFAGVFFVLALASCFVTIRLITQQVAVLSSAMTTLGQDADLNVKAKALSRDELGALAGSFNQMVSQMRALLTEMQQADAALTTTSTNLSEVSRSVKEQVDQGQHQTTQAADSMHEMGGTVKEVADNCATSAEQSGQASHDADNGSQMLNGARADMKNLSEDLSNTNSIIQRLANDSDEIGSIVDVIRGVAEQTNLLALNAAIEAARAGEQGRGFAVVADEVRTLALKTQQSTGQIQDNIEKIQQGSQQAAQAIGESLNRAEKTDQSLDNALESIHNVMGQIDKVSQMNAQVAAATEQQSAAVEEISGSVKVIRQRYQETHQSVGELHDATNAINELSGNLSQSIKRFKL